MKYIIYTFGFTILLACNNSNTPESSSLPSKSDLNIPTNIKFKIIKEEPNEAFSKDNIEVSLNKKVDKSVLKKIALSLRAERSQYEKIWIFYKIQENTLGSNVWATSHFTPELEVNILGSTEEQDKTTSAATEVKGEIIGKWRSEKSLSGASLVLYKNDFGQKLIKIIFKDGQSMEDKITESKQGVKVRYDDGNSHGEYYILESNGNLGMYGQNGKFDEAVKIK